MLNHFYESVDQTKKDFKKKRSKLFFSYTSNVLQISHKLYWKDNYKCWVWIKTCWDYRFFITQYELVMRIGYLTRKKKKGRIEIPYIQYRSSIASLGFSFTVVITTEFIKKGKLGSTFWWVWGSSLFFNSQV